MSAPTYASSLANSKPHIQKFFQVTIGQHPMFTALVILLLVLYIVWTHWESRKAKAKFTGNHSMWHGGSGDAGAGGSLDRADIRSPAAVASPCGPHQTLVKDSTGAQWCHNNSTVSAAGLTPAACSAAWDPAATAEAQALAQLGGFQHDTFGENRLQSAVNQSLDGGSGAAHADTLLYQ